MNKLIKILTVCQKGNCRSVGARYRLNRRRFGNVIAIGATNTTQQTLQMLCEWADLILLAEPHHGRFLPRGFDDKFEKNFTIGPDLWNNALDPELQSLLRHKLNELNLR